MVKLFVGNLADSVDSCRLKNLFLQFVHVQECDVLKNFAFVHVITEEDADTAISKLEKYNLEGREIHVERSTSRLRKEPGMSDKCFTCGAFDHKTPLCPYESNKKAASPAVAATVVTTGLKRSDDFDPNASGGGAKKARFLSSYLTPTITTTSDVAHYSASVVDAPTSSMYPPSWGVKVGGGSETDPELPCPQNPELRTLYDQYMESRTRYFFYRERLSKEIKLQVESGGFLVAHPHEVTPQKPIHLGTIDLTKKIAPTPVSTVILNQPAQTQPYFSQTTISIQQQQSLPPSFQPTQQQTFVGLVSASSHNNVVVPPPLTSSMAVPSALPISSFHSQPSAIPNPTYSTYSFSNPTGSYDPNANASYNPPQQASITSHPTSQYNAPSSFNATQTTTLFSSGATSVAAAPQITQITRVNLSAALAASNTQNYARSSQLTGAGSSPAKSTIPSGGIPPPMSSANKFGGDSVTRSINVTGNNVLGGRFSGTVPVSSENSGSSSTTNSNVGNAINAANVVGALQARPLFGNLNVLPSLAAVPSAAPPSLLASLKSLPATHNPYGANPGLKQPSPYNPHQSHTRMPPPPHFSQRFPSPNQRTSSSAKSYHHPPAKS